MYFLLENYNGHLILLQYSISSVINLSQLHLSASKFNCYHFNRYSLTLKRNALDDASAKYGAMHKKIRSEATENGNNLQLERMKIRLSDHDNKLNTKD